MYSAIGGLFEYLNQDCGYEEWSQYLIKRLAALGAGRTGVDVGCGNGYFTRALCKAGYDVKGMDISPECLSRAVEIAKSEGVRTEFLCGDITKLHLGGKVCFITAINDCINYIPPQKLKETFSRVHANLKKGGIFFFDVSAPQKLRSSLGNHTIVKDYDKATLIWCNTLKEDRVEMDLTLFTLCGDGKYMRTDESQTQYIHTEEDILKLLKECDFDAFSEGHLGLGKDERINFICKKP